MVTLRPTVFSLLFAVTMTLCCTNHAKEQPCEVFPPTALTDGVKVRINGTFVLKCTFRASNSDTAVTDDNNMSLYYDLNEWDNLIRPIGNSYETVHGLFSSKLTWSMDSVQHTKSLELTIHGSDREDFQNFTISFAVGTAAENRTDPIRVIVVGPDDPETTEVITEHETTQPSAVTTVTSGVSTTELDPEAIVKEAQQDVKEAQRKSTTFQYTLVAIGLVLIVSVILNIIFIVYIANLKRWNKNSSGSQDSKV